MNMDVAMPVATAQYGVTPALEHMEAAIFRLEEELSALYNHLGPILFPASQDSTPTDPGPAMPEVSGLAQSVYSKVGRLENIVFVIQQLNSRVDV